MEPGYLPYEPQSVPVERASGLWTVEGPEIGYRFAGLAIPCPTRMTVIRLADNSLWLHSPTAFSQGLAARIAELGPVAALVSPNALHHAHIADWSRHFPEAQLFAMPELRAQPHLAQSIALGPALVADWLGEIAQVFVDIGPYRESVFFHHATRTLIVTDLMQNFEGERVTNPIVRLLLRAGGATGPRGQPSLEVRIAARRHRPALVRAFGEMIALAPERIVLSHGRCYDSGAVAEIRRAFPGLA